MNNRSLSIRNKRYESVIKKIITECISYEIYNDDIKLVTITNVSLTNDKSIAKIYIDCYNKAIIDRVLRKINEASGVFRTALAKQLNWRKAPKVIFVKDTSSDRYNEVNDLLNSLKVNNG